MDAWASRGCTDQLLDRDLIQVAEAQVQLVAVQLFAEIPALVTGLGHGDAGGAVPSLSGCNRQEMLEKPHLGSGVSHPTDNAGVRRRRRCKTSAARLPAGRTLIPAPRSHRCRRDDDHFRVHVTFHGHRDAPG